MSGNNTTGGDDQRRHAGGFGRHNLGAASGGLTFNGGTCGSARTSADRTITLDAGGGTFDPMATARVGGSIGGSGSYQDGHRPAFPTGVSNYGGGADHIGRQALARSAKRPPRSLAR